MYVVFAVLIDIVLMVYAVEYGYIIPETDICDEVVIFVISDIATPADVVFHNPLWKVPP